MRLFEQVLGLWEPESGLHGYMVLHDTSRGPATGGIRLYPYASDREALEDGMRLARAMTEKAKASDLPVGGGKIVLFEPPPERREAALAAVGRTLEDMGGRFLAGRDVGLPVDDGAKVRAHTRFMVDESTEGVGDLNEKTALGVLEGARAGVAHLRRTSSFEGLRVVVQGVGGVGAWLARMLAAEGATVIAADPSAEALAALQEDTPVTVVSPDDVFDVPCDVFAPCALGGVITPDAAGRIDAAIVAGSANNILSEDGAAGVLHDRGIVYVPELVINAGAVIQGVRFLLHGERDSRAAILAIGARAATLLEASAAAGRSPWDELRERLAED